LCAAGAACDQQCPQQKAGRSAAEHSGSDGRISVVKIRACPSA
jgi:hypothetical protein